MSDTFAVNVVTPVGPVAQTKTDAVIAPGALGEFEVLAGHVPFLTELHAGVLRIGEKGGQVFAVSKGFLEVEPSGSVQVLAEKAVPVAKIDAEAAGAEVETLEVKIKDWKGETDAEYKNLADRLAFARAQIAALAAG